MLNPLFQGANLSMLDQVYPGYGVSTTRLHVLVQLKPQMNYLYEDKRILINADAHPGVYTLDVDMGWDGSRSSSITSFFAKPG